MRHIIITLLLFWSCAAMAQGGGQAGNEGRKSVGLVLSGGGAKGAAHIPAIKALEEAGIPIDYIAGTSMGAIIGGLYAIGYDTRTLDSLVRALDWNTLIYDRVNRTDLSFGAKELDDKYLLTVEIGPGRKVQLPSGLIGGRNIYNLLYELTIGYHGTLDFSQLPVPFACVGYDMVSGRSITLDHGSLPVCIRASMSIPGAFSAVEVDDMVLVDGGIGNNFPADVVRSMGADIVIGIDVTAPLKTKEELNSFAAIFDQITSFTALDSYNRNLELVDLYIHPDITGYNAASFSADAIDTLLRRGAEAMELHRDAIFALREKIGLTPEYTSRERESFLTDQPIPVGNIVFEGLRSENERALRRIVGIRENSVVRGDELRQAVNKLSGLNSLSSVHYRLEDDSLHTLTFVVAEANRNTLSAGLRFDTEEMAAILLNLRFAGRNMTNSYFDITGKLGTNPFGTLSYFYGNETQRRFNISYTFRSNDLNLYRRAQKISNLDFTQNTVDMNFSNIRLRNFRIALGARYDYYDFSAFISNSESDGRVSSHGLISYYGLAQYESLDSRYYPRRGSSVAASYMLTTDNFVGYRGGVPFSAIKIDWMSAFSISKRVTLIPGLFGRVLIGKNIAYLHNNFMGGPVAGRYVPQQIAFIGLSGFEQFDRGVVGARFEARVRMWVKNYLSLKANYAKYNGNFFEILQGGEVLGFGVNYSYNSFIGPIDILVDYSPRNKKVGFYFNLGYYF